MGASTLAIRGEIQFQGNSAPIRLNNTYSGETSLSQQASLGIAVPLAYALQSDFDALLLPGGPGVKALRADGRPARLARAFADGFNAAGSGSHAQVLKAVVVS